MQLSFVADVFARLRDFQDADLCSALTALGMSPGIGPTAMEDLIAVHLGDAYAHLRPFVSLDRKSVHYHKRDEAEVGEIVDILMHQCLQVRKFVIAIAQSLELENAASSTERQRTIAAVAAATFSVMTQQDWVGQDPWFDYEGSWYLDLASATEALLRVLFEPAADPELLRALREHLAKCFDDFVEPTAQQLIDFYAGLQRMQP